MVVRWNGFWWCITIGCACFCGVCVDDVRTRCYQENKRLMHRCLYAEELLDPKLEEQQKRDRAWHNQAALIVASSILGWWGACVVRSLLEKHTPIGSYGRAERAKFLYQRNLVDGVRRVLDSLETLHDEVLAAPDGTHPRGSAVASVVVPACVQRGTVERSSLRHKANYAHAQEGLQAALWLGFSVGLYYLIAYEKKRLARPYTALLRSIIGSWKEHRDLVPDFMVMDGDYVHALFMLHKGTLVIDERDAEEIVKAWVMMCLEARWALDHVSTAGGSPAVHAI